MTKAELQEILDRIGVRADQVAEDFEEKVDEWKSGLDAETRRAVRPYWITIAVIAFVLGCGVGYLF
nr:MAG TPA: protein of unknown function (DUF883) [Caudoviricetes sp.]